MKLSMICSAVLALSQAAPGMGAESEISYRLFEGDLIGGACGTMKRDEPLFRTAECHSELSITDIYNGPLAEPPVMRNSFWQAPYWNGNSMTVNTEVTKWTEPSFDIPPNSANGASALASGATEPTVATDPSLMMAAGALAGAVTGGALVAGIRGASSPFISRRRGEDKDGAAPQDKAVQDVTEAPTEEPGEPVSGLSPDAEFALTFANQCIALDVTPLDAWRFMPSKGDQRQLHALAPSQLGIISAKGPVRSKNDDFASGVHLQDKTTFLISADGLGGYTDGNRASRIVTAVAWQVLARLSGEGTLRTAIEAVFARSSEVMAEIARHLGYEPEEEALATTLIVVGADAEQYICGWMGDGGAYVCRSDGSVEPLMEAHKGAHQNEVTRLIGPTTYGAPQFKEARRGKEELLALGSDGVFDRVDGEHFMTYLTDRYRNSTSLQNVIDNVVAYYGTLRSNDGSFLADDNMTIVALATP